MKVRFTADHDWDVPEFKGRVTIHRPEGWAGTVRRLHGEAAITAGKALETHGTENRRRTHAGSAHRAASN